MSFINSNALYLLPVALLPLLSLFLKKPAGRIFLVSWLFLVDRREMTRKRRIIKDLIVFLRVLILLLLIVFISKPVPKRLNFDLIYFERGVFSKAIERQLSKDYNTLKSFYGGKIEAFDSVLNVINGKRKDRGTFKMYIISDFSSPLFLNGGNCEIFYDTISIRNVGIRSIRFEPFNGLVYVSVHNYNYPDSNILLSVRELKINEVLLIPPGKNLDFPLYFKSQNEFVSFFLAVNDDIEVDNQISFKNIPILTYFDYGNNELIREFLDLFAVGVDRDSAELLIGYNMIPSPSGNTRIILIFLNKPLNQLNLFTGISPKYLKEVTFDGINLGSALIFKSKKFEDIQDIMEGVTYEVIIGGIKYIFVGMTPELSGNDLAYYPKFWEHLLRLVNFGPQIAYSISEGVVGKMFNDTLFLFDTLQANPAAEFYKYLNAQHLPRKGIIKLLNIIKYGILLSMLILGVFELVLTRKYFSIQ